MLLGKWISLGLVLTVAGFAADSGKAAPQGGAKAAVTKKKAGKADLAAGKKVFETYCTACHGAVGKGDGAASAALNPKPRDLTDAEYMGKQAKDKLRKVISEGGQAVGLSPVMAAWKGSLKETEIDAVLAYVLTLSKLAK